MPSRYRVKVSHVIVECRVIYHHPDLYSLFKGAGGSSSRFPQNILFSCF